MRYMQYRPDFPSTANVHNPCALPGVIRDVSLIERCDTLNGSFAVPLATDPGEHVISLAATDVGGDLEFFAPEPPAQDTKWTIKLEFLNVVAGSLTFRNLSLSQFSLPKGLKADALVFDNVVFDSISGSADLELDLATNTQSITVNGCSGLTMLEITLLPDFDDPLLNASFTATRNPDLARVSLGGYRDISTDVTVQDNSGDISLVMTDMTTGSLNLERVHQFQAVALASLVPNVLTGSGSTFEDNTVTTFEFSRLTSMVDAPVVFINNFRLTTINMPNLGNISNLTIVDASMLREVDLPNVSTIGTLEISGPFTE